MKSGEVKMSALKAPHSPGVYFFKALNNEILYVGKALNLANRLLQYQDVQQRGLGITNMVAQTKTITWQETGSEIEAVLQEATLIRQLKPKYNSLGKDDKSYSYLRINWSERYPRLYVVRERDIERGLISINPKSRKKDEALGPFVSLALPSVIRVLRHIWPFRDCTRPKFASYQRLGRGCLYHQLGLCTAPCIAAISEVDYLKNLKQLRLFLGGKKEQVLTQLETEMKRLSKQGEYEQAAVVRDRWLALADLRSLTTRGILRNFEEPLSPKSEVKTVEAYDISNIGGEYAVGVLIRAAVPVLPRLVGSDIYLQKDAYRKFRIKTVKQANDVAMLAEVLTRRFQRARTGGSFWALPDLIMVDGGQAQLTVARQAAKGNGVNIPIMAVAKGKTRKKVDLYIRPQDEVKVPFVKAVWPQIALSVREEAHRYAIAYYRLLHRRSLRS
ncbi:MAG: GIY-YIG nuclease family protein [bacterium]|nr:GIY-YIG nuclease family protein [bacterium]